MTTYLRKVKTTVTAFSLLLLTVITSAMANAASQELQTSHRSAPVQVAALAHPGAAVVHRRNAKARRHSAAHQHAATHQPAAATSNTKPH